jgi:hypothetical protein
MEFNDLLDAKHRARRTESRVLLSLVSAVNKKGLEPFRLRDWSSPGGLSCDDSLKFCWLSPVGDYQRNSRP